jgi:uncharacterized protein (TIGR00369 family)
MSQTPIDRIPFLRLLGIQQLPTGPGRSRLRLPELKDEFCNMLGAVHGGVLMTLLDVAMARAATSRVEAPTATVVTVEMSSRFVRPGRGPLTAEGRVLAAGGSLCTCEAQVHDAGGGLVAHATGTFKYWRSSGGGVD